MKDNILNFLFSALQITLIDIVLSGDNIGIIALAVRKLPAKQAKVANIIGVAGAVCMRIMFASLVTVLMSVEWLPIKLIGGILLLSITWDLVNPREREMAISLNPQRSFWKAVYNIIMADISMSIDNVLAIGGVAKGNIGLVIFGLLLNIPIIFLGTRLVMRLISKYSITIYLGAGVLVHTALDLMLEDKLISHYTDPLFKAIFPWIIGAFAVAYGIAESKEIKK